MIEFGLINAGQKYSKRIAEKRWWQTILYKTYTHSNNIAECVKRQSRCIQGNTLSITQQARVIVVPLWNSRDICTIAKQSLMALATVSQKAARWERCFDIKRDKALRFHVPLSYSEYNTESARIPILPLMGPGEEKPGPRTHFHVEHEDRTIYPPLPKRMPEYACARCD